MKLKDFDFRIWNTQDEMYLEREYTKKFNCFDEIGYAVGIRGDGVSKFVYEISSGLNSTEDGLDDYEWIENLGENKWEIELFTGLYDKNRKKIYEGDIVEVDSEPYNFIDSIYIDTIRGIEFKNRTLYLTDVVSCFTHGDILEEIEVVGNIHENKDLKGFAKEIKKGDIFLFKGNEYIYLGEIINKTTDKQMVIYSANRIYYVREKEDFLSKFKPKDNK